MVIILFLFSKIKLCSFKSLEANSYVHFSMLFIHQHNTDFFSFFVFLIYNDVYFENTQCYKKDCNQKTQRSPKNYYRQIRITKRTSYYLMKDQTEKYLSLVATKSIEKYLMLVMLKNNVSHF